MKKIIYLFLVIAILGSSNQEKKLPKNFDFGKTENGSYVNDYFEMNVSFNPNWIVQDKQEMNNLIELGEEFVTRDNDNLINIMKASQVNTAYLLAVFKYEVGAAVEYNPSLLLIGENTKTFLESKMGRIIYFMLKNY